MKTFIALGSEAEVVGILPIVQREFETTGEKQVLIVFSACLPLVLQVPFVEPVPVSISMGLAEALMFAKQRSGAVDEVISFPSAADDKGFPTEHRHPSHQFDQWDRAACLHLWDTLPLTLPRSAMEQWPFKTIPFRDNPKGRISPFQSLPFILLADDDPDHPFPFKDELFALLVKEFPLHQIVRLSEISFAHLFDVLALYDAADLIVCAETVHLQLSRACKTPVIALANDQSTVWHGSAPSSRFAFYTHYGNFQEVKDALVIAAKNAIWPLSEADAPASAKPSVTLVYIYVPGNAEYDKFTQRFVASYLKFKSGIAHRTMIVCQGRKPAGETLESLMMLPNCSFYVHNNSGWDIGAFITVSRIIPEDMMVCFGSSAYFKREGWLARMVDVWQKHGPGFYGSLASYEISPHINTSGFWCPPRLLSEYPLRVQTKAQRYDFEFGKNALWKWCLKNGVKARLATWDGEYEWPDWRKPDNIYRRGDQSNCLAFFHHNENFERASAEKREQMSKFADTLKDAQYIKMEQQLHVIEPPKVAVVVYVYPTMGGKHDEMAARFAASYQQYPAGEPHDLWVVSNGGEPTPKMRQTFAGIACNFLVHDDTGLDIGAYRKAAREIPCELMVFFGGNTYLFDSGWLKRMVEAFRKHGRALYGATGNQGDANVRVWPHIRTTGFWMPPELLNRYPHTTDSTTHSRYEFEHGQNGLTSWVKAQGLKVFMVTWSGEYEWPNWDSIPNGFHRGDQSDLLVGDRLTGPEYHPRQALRTTRTTPRPVIQPTPRLATIPSQSRLAIRKRR